MNKQDQEEHRLAALAAGYHRLLGTCYKVPTIARDGVPVEWHPKTNKADSFVLLLAVYGTKDPDRWSDIDDILASEKSTEEKMTGIFSVAVAMGRSMEASNEQAAD